jgi:iron complex transport system substrate-binding protein
MAAFASLLAASAVQLASLNLCSDEYALLLAHPGEVVSVSRLSQDPAESALAPLARRATPNRGRLEDIVATRPTVVLTMGGGGRSSAAIARALGLTVIDLPQPATIADVGANITRVATALGDRSRAAPWLQRLARLQSRPPTQRDAIYLGHGGLSQSPGSLGATWMALAGLRQRSLPAGRATLETFATRPPQVLLLSNYRSGQVSSGQRWLHHPLLAQIKSRRLITDGRAWTCGGPMMIPEVERLRRLAR